MHDDRASAPGMASGATYQITVCGRLAEHWVDWFNGTLISYGLNNDGGATTNLICRVRDQAELLGVLNRLYSLGMPLMQVILQ